MPDAPVSPELLDKTLAVIGSAQEELEEAYNELYRALINSRLALLGLAMGDRLFFTDEYRHLKGLDTVPGAVNYLNHTERLYDWHDDYLRLGYEFRGEWTVTSGIPHIPLDVVKRMKAEADRRDGKIVEEPPADAPQPLTPLEDAVLELLETLPIFPSAPVSAPSPVSLDDIRAHLASCDALVGQLHDLKRDPIMDYVGSEADRSEDVKKLQNKLTTLRLFYPDDVRALLGRLDFIDGRLNAALNVREWERADELSAIRELIIEALSGGEAK